ncbi:hypothetical protein DWB77_06699 [Streptomyces hundungensis]|uniref:Uncharacterized protein n=1 Tax=Streptomyces hundungensis TaxID=1077946 RepID=A0A387HKU6_9ACTN|nr:hypothetical protein [Streptomyces hundungensis]AYG84485.1 hypothetical protein DWB77_06699 [Streptomyces hundungensis]
MSGHGNGPGIPERPVERRLRGALAARADSIAPGDLRPAAPPGPPLRRAPLARLRRRRFALPLAALATAAAIAAGWFTLAPGPDVQRPLPAGSPGPVQPPPTPGPPTFVPPTPAPAEPPAAPSRTPSVHRSRTPGAGPVPNSSAPSADPGRVGSGRGSTPAASAPPSRPPGR